MIVNGTTYSNNTPREVIDILESHRAVRERNPQAVQARLRVHYGDVKTGRDWMDEWDVEGYIGRSTGSIKVPLIVHNTRSMGGPAMLDHCIVRIRIAGKRGVDLYRHPNYHIDPLHADTPYTDEQLDRNWPGWRDDEAFVSARAEAGLGAPA